MNKNVFGVVGGKGGIGKSFAAWSTIAAMRAYNIEVEARETDTTNSSLGQSGLCTEPPWDLRDPTSQGSIASVVTMYEQGYSGNVVIDLGARDEELFADHLEWFDDLLKGQGVRFYALRPLTLNGYTSLGAREFAQRFPGIPQILLLNLGQGRKRKDFSLWDNSDLRKDILQGMAVEIELDEFSPILADNAASLGLTPSDIVAGDFSNVPEPMRAFAASVFTRDRQKFVELYLDRHYRRLVKALEALEISLSASTARGGGGGRKGGSR